MKAAVLKALHEPLVYEEVDQPLPASGEVLVAVKAASLNHRDVWIQKGLYPRAYAPAILGSDGAGIISMVGEGVDATLIGKSVIINPGHDWGDAETHYGPGFTILGLEAWGTFAEYVKVRVGYIADKPAHLSFEQAAALPLAGVTAWRSLMTRAGLKRGEKVLITGAGGGVALFAIQFAVAAGAEVWVTSGNEDKIEKAVLLGAEGGFNYRAENWHREALARVGAPKSGYFDVIIDSAGGPEFHRLTDLAAPGGRICFYGGTVGNITDLVPAKVFFKQLSILGSTMGSPRDFAAMLAFVEEKKLEPVIDVVLPFEEIGNGMIRMEAGKQFGKIVFVY